MGQGSAVPKRAVERFQHGKEVWKTERALKVLTARAKRRGRRKREGRAEDEGGEEAGGGGDVSQGDGHREEAHRDGGTGQLPGSKADIRVSGHLSAAASGGRERRHAGAVPAAAIGNSRSPQRRGNYEGTERGK